MRPKRGAKGRKDSVPRNKYDSHPSWIARKVHNPNNGNDRIQFARGKK